MHFLEILCLTMLGIVAFIIITILSIWILLLLWPLIIIALPIAGLIYLIQIKEQKKKRK